MSEKDIEIDNVIVAHNLLSTPMENEKWIRIASPLLRALADEVERLRQENKELKTCDHCERPATQTVCALH